MVRRQPSAMFHSVGMVIGVLMIWCLSDGVLAAVLVSKTSGLQFGEHPMRSVKTLIDGRISITTLTKRTRTRSSSSSGSWESATASNLIKQSSTTADSDVPFDAKAISNPRVQNFKHASFRQLLEELSRALDGGGDDTQEAKREPLTGEYLDNFQHLKLRLQQAVKHRLTSDELKGEEPAVSNGQINRMVSSATASEVDTAAGGVDKVLGTSDEQFVESSEPRVHFPVIVGSNAVGNAVTVSRGAEGNFGSSRLLTEVTSAPTTPTGNRRLFLLYKDEVVLNKANGGRKQPAGNKLTADLNLSTVLRTTSVDNNGQMVDGGASRPDPTVVCDATANGRKPSWLLRPLVISSAAACAILFVIVSVLTVIFYHLNKPKFKWTLKHPKCCRPSSSLRNAYFRNVELPSRLQDYYLKWNDCNSQAAILQMETGGRAASSSNTSSPTLPDSDVTLTKPLVSYGRAVA